MTLHALTTLLFLLYSNSYLANVEKVLNIPLKIGHNSTFFNKPVNKQPGLRRLSEFDKLLIGNNNATGTFSCLMHFMPLVSFCTPVKKLKNHRFSDAFREYRKSLIGGNKYLGQNIQDWTK